MKADPTALGMPRLAPSAGSVAPGDVAPKHLRPLPAWTKVLPSAAVVLALLLALAVDPYAATVAMLLLAAWSLTGVKQALQALSLVVLIKFLNPALYEFAPSIALCAWIAFGAASLRIFAEAVRTRGQRHRALPWLAVFAAVVAVEAVLTSRHGLVSLFKIASFTCMAAASLIGFRWTAKHSIDWTPWFVGIWIAVIAASLPTLAVRSIGFHTNDTGFQGILNHPQAFGVFVAPMVAWATGRLLLSRANAPWLYAAVPAAWVLLYLTAARTGVAALVLGSLIVLCAALLLRRDWRQPIGRALFRPLDRKSTRLNSSHR